MRRANRKIFPLFLGLLLLSIPLFSQANGPQSFTGKVVGVSDGDTISVMREGKAVKVRLHGIDCPEKKQAFGTRAKQCTSDMVFDKDVEVRIQTTDRYWRLVGEVILPDGNSSNKELVYVGPAWWYRKYAPNDRALGALEARARESKRGVVGGQDPIPPWEWRRGKRGHTKKEHKTGKLL